MSLAQSIAAATDPMVLMMIVLATVFGAIIGALPGFSSVMAISLLLPVVYPMDPLMGLLVLGSIYMGAMYGDANAAILLNIPGTASSLPTTFDGFPMTRQGRAREAMLAALAGSVFGGVTGVLVLLLSFGALAEFSLRFGPQEYFWLTVLGLTTIAALSEGNMVKGLVGGGLGIAISLIGLDSYWGTPRFTFGQSSLMAGIHLIPALLGLFCVSQVFASLAAPGGDRRAPEIGPQKDALHRVLRTMVRRWDVMLRSSAIGVVIGMLPGAGGPIASTISYNETRRWDRDSSSFGKGRVEGVFASEVANNAMVGGSLIPMMALGIPGNVNAAVILGALLSFGMRPGMNLMTDGSGIAMSFMIGLLISSILLAPLGYFLIIRVSTLVLRIPRTYLAPTILVFATVGAYSVTNSMYGVVIMTVMGIGGYAFRRIGIEAAPIGLGMILGPIAEREFTSSMLIAHAQGSYWSIAMRPISLVLIALCLLSIATPLLLALRSRRAARRRAETTASEQA
ncbi:tripartite tricarboxylate transporter permease [Frigidibacter sp. ROC022]|uniref:tripartite tricarboxylate transporter permease n=1 Tax=Frigidibacter sp. ROC022 TaxID=2971796 RepID=UPI00215B4BA4|nr:tripartite tricarboxylate transporter permease [Frigidibacter sp. ROC022]MCR8726007.1 tripartite tricarboxylate transporter permease [Frigidibacter sp. ROC022]